MIIQHIWLLVPDSLNFDLDFLLQRYNVDHRLRRGLPFDLQPKASACSLNPPVSTSPFL